MAVDLSNPQFVAGLIARERRQSRSGGRWILLPIVVLTLIYLMPFYYLLVTVFKSTPEYEQKGVLELPSSLAPFLDNVMQAWTIAHLGAAGFNSLSYAVVGGAIAVAFAAGAAYGMTRLNLLGATGWFMPEPLMGMMLVAGAPLGATGALFPSWTDWGFGWPLTACLPESSPSLGMISSVSSDE